MYQVDVSPLTFKAGEKTNYSSNHVFCEDRMDPNLQGHCACNLRGSPRPRRSAPVERLIAISACRLAIRCAPKRRAHSPAPTPAAHPAKPTSHPWPHVTMATTCEHAKGHWRLDLVPMLWIVFPTKKIPLCIWTRVTAILSLSCYSAHLPKSPTADCFGNRRPRC